MSRYLKLGTQLNTSMAVVLVLGLVEVVGVVSGCKKGQHQCGDRGGCDYS